MEKKLTAIKVHLKNGAFRNFSVNGKVNFRQLGDFIHIDDDGKTFVTIAMCELSFVEYFYSEAESKQ